MTAWLVTGGAGYIGAHVVSALLDAGFEAVAYDNLSTGKRAFVPDGAPLVEGDILDTDAVTSALTAHGCVG
ncbi:MAG: UDP-glucose 4-epimerase GalE, partial [Actinobacteria bacterium HGW-Actinobacteria-8]